MAINARGGPGIVLASVALDAGIIAASFFTTLVLLSLVTSVIAGSWLEATLRRGGTLLTGHDPLLAALDGQERPASGDPGSVTQP